MVRINRFLIVLALILTVFSFSISLASASTTKIYLLNGSEANDGMILNETKVNIIANNNESIGFILYSIEKTNNLIDKNLKKLCELCSPNINYSRALRLSEGDNYIFVKDSMNTTAQKTYLSVDTKKPLIKKISGVKNRISNGLINISFNEQTPEEILFIYKELSESDYHSVEINKTNQCSNNSGLWNCFVNTSSINQLLNGQAISFLFNVSDRFNTISSKIFNSSIDTQNPVISILSPLNNTVWPDNTGIFFSVGINEGAKINYEVDFDGKTKILCRNNCTLASRNLKFSEGNHTIIFFAEDLAGNMASESVSIVAV